MSELIKDHGVTKLLTLMLLIFTVSLFIILTMVPSSIFQREMEVEVKSLSSLMTESRWVEVTLQVERSYRQSYIDSGLQKMVEDTLLPKGNFKIKELVEKFKGDFILQRVVNNIHIMSYQMVYRMTMMKYWIWVMVPLFFALIYDGYMIRKIRMYEPKQISIKSSRIWTRSIVYIIVFTFCYMLIPNILGQKAPWFPVLMLILTGVAFKNIIQNYMKVA
ncbi:MULTISPECIES: DUF4400 domain-containing protein [Shewanella]|jgi:hypothetical protein|uniref:DUF4400 domain-containing protein n=1 Tax=Shewanella TaxID=22 RepID=UPI000849C813|nr:DUF4400 domain-containing protein [Shewanella xiamenensis]MCT8865555.1 DUF4400 domain-containing protein [Shewanella xiamenensis]MCT8878382.1 DUF4400 domain-containing protein [Shewanella xiamenensis]ODR83632.1 hypothetical protein ABT47_22900 [Shewanella xiamenensis]BDQ68372.1 hypothetical protein NUITMVS2_41850 [Shewanella xiamenensis]GLD78097.1 hypothetical protein NUITMVS3_25290 [Shewanella xiamenensis]